MSISLEYRQSPEFRQECLREVQIIKTSLEGLKQRLSDTLGADSSEFSRAEQAMAALQRLEWVITGLEPYGTEQHHQE